MKEKLIIICIVIAGIFRTSGQSIDLPLITVNESEVSYAKVDEIHFSLVIQSYAKEIDAAREKNRDIAESVFKYLNEKNIPKQYVQTKRMRISRNYVRNRNPKEYDGFIAHQNIYVCLKNIDAYDEIIDSLLTMDIDQVIGPDFKSSSYESTLKEARIKALKKARISAERMASALGQKIGKAKLIETKISNQNNSAYSSHSASNAQSKQSSFEIGEIEIVATVQVSFELL